jgi:hypothetical protein
MINERELAETARLRLSKVTFKSNGCTLFIPRDRRLENHDWVTDQIRAFADRLDDDDYADRVSGCALVAWTVDDKRRIAWIKQAPDDQKWMSDIPDFVRTFLWQEVIARN